MPKISKFSFKKNNILKKYFKWSNSEKCDFFADIVDRPNKKMLSRIRPLLSFKKKAKVCLLGIMKAKRSFVILPSLIFSCRVLSSSSHVNSTFILRLIL